MLCIREVPEADGAPEAFRFDVPWKHWSTALVSGSAVESLRSVGSPGCSWRCTVAGLVRHPAFGSRPVCRRFRSGHDLQTDPAAAERCSSCSSGYALLHRIPNNTRVK